MFKSIAIHLLIDYDTPIGLNHSIIPFLFSHRTLFRDFFAKFHININRNQATQIFTIIGALCITFI